MLIPDLLERLDGLEKQIREYIRERDALSLDYGLLVLSHTQLEKKLKEKTDENTHLKGQLEELRSRIKR